MRPRWQLLVSYPQIYKTEPLIKLRGPWLWFEEIYHQPPIHCLHLSSKADHTDPISFPDFDMELIQTSIHSTQLTHMAIRYWTQTSFHVRKRTVVARRICYRSLLCLSTHQSRHSLVRSVNSNHKVFPIFRIRPQELSMVWDILRLMPHLKIKKLLICWSRPHWPCYMAQHFDSKSCGQSPTCRQFNSKIPTKAMV